MSGVEYRIRCASFGTDGHRTHAYPQSKPKGWANAQHRAELNTNDPVDTPIGRECKPFVAECRYVSPWTDDFEGLVASVTRSAGMEQGRLL